MNLTFLQGRCHSLLPPTPPCFVGTSLVIIAIWILCHTTASIKCEKCLIQNTTDQNASYHLLCLSALLNSLKNL